MLHQPDKLRFINDLKESRLIRRKPNEAGLFYSDSTFSLFHHFQVIDDEAHVDTGKRRADDVTHESR